MRKNIISFRRFMLKDLEIKLLCYILLLYIDIDIDIYN